jgi:MoaA/NifB/PqqE/SkfB family radical SAM enzyme
MSKIKIPHLEWHVAHSCNLTCQGCLHFSDYGHEGITDYETIKKWYSEWSPRLAPKTIDILGGEPLLNKDILKIISLTREMWDDPYLETINLQSNGLLLDRFPDLPIILKEANCSICLSQHGNDPVYNKIFEKAKTTLAEWQDQYGIKTNIIDFYTFWMKPYLGYGDTMEPYEDNDPDESWNNCPTGQDCFQIHQGNIYKCSPLAYLPMQQTKVNLSKKWDFYLTYQPLTPTATDQEVIDFFNKGAEKFCGMCPTKTELFEKPSPLTPRKQILMRRIP